jgi:Ca-activated chloride channel family protein
MSKGLIAFFIQLFLLFFPSLGSADGFIVIPSPPLHTTAGMAAFPLEVRFHKVDVTITDRAALTKVDQEFYNPSPYLLEGEYIFPIPKGAVINNFSMYINGKEVKAELLDAAKAKQIYEDIVRKKLDPALLEYQEQSLFRARIFPIEAHSTKRVILSYAEILDKDSSTTSYLYPLNTEKFSAKVLDSVAINVTLKTKEPIKSIYSTTHEVEVIRKSNTYALISYEEENTKPDTDFRLYYTLDKSDIGMSLLTYKTQSEDGYFFLDICPNFEAGPPLPKDITFVLDVSGSMKGEKLSKAKLALSYCLSHLNPGDRFEIIRFGTEGYALFNALREADSTNLEQARRFIEGLEALGGTNIGEALTLALASRNNSPADAARPYIVIFITDGQPTIGETDDLRLLQIIKKANNDSARIFTFGIGYEINTHLLDKITDFTRAYRTYLSPKADIEKEIAHFYEKVRSPVLTNLEISSQGSVRFFHTYPDLKELPDLFWGSSLTLLGRYKGNGSAVINLKGKVNNKVREYTYTLDFPSADTTNTFIPPIWAARRIGMLLDQMRLYGESEEVKEEIITLARTHGIITPYTSLLILEDETAKTARRELDPRHQTMGNMVLRSEELTEKSAKEYNKLKDNSGMDSVQASEELQLLNKAQNSRQTKKGINRLDFQDKNGANQSMEAQIKNIQGRAFYNSGNGWIDSQLQTQKGLSVIRIQFASSKYFELLQKNKTAGEILALGKNVQFVMNNQIYEIYE